MPCCVLGALFMAQCLAAVNWFRKLFGRGEGNTPVEKSLLRNRRGYGKWVVLLLSIELLAIVVIVMLPDQAGHHHM